MASFGGDVFIQVRINEGGLNDAIYYTFAEFDAMSDVQIEEAKRERASSWLRVQEEARLAVPVSPTREELLEHREEIERRLAEVDERLSQ